MMNKMIHRMKSNRALLFLSARYHKEMPVQSDKPEEGIQMPTSPEEYKEFFNAIHDNIQEWQREVHGIKQNIDPQTGQLRNPISQESSHNIMRLLDKFTASRPDFLPKKRAYDSSAYPKPYPTETQDDEAAGSKSSSTKENITPDAPTTTNNAGSNDAVKPKSSKGKDGIRKRFFEAISLSEKDDKKKNEPMRKDKRVSEIEPKEPKSKITESKHEGSGKKETKPPLPPAPVQEGFSLYGTKDEEGLHIYDGGSQEEDLQDDYDLEEVNDDLHHSPTEHHIELELQPECDVHGSDPCDCPVYEGDCNEERSYDFTFEYNQDGKLVPTFDGMKGEEHEQIRSKSDKITELPQKKSKKKKKKLLKQPSVSATNNTNGATNGNGKKIDPSEENCLFCDYEAIFGHPPRQLMKLYNQQIKEADKRKADMRRKLQRAKQNAIQRQKNKDEEEVKSD